MNIPLTIKKLHELEIDPDPIVHEKKLIFECLEKNLNFKDHYEMVSMGSHGVIISPSFSINYSEKLEESFNKLNFTKNNYISKILDLHNEKEIYIQKEIYISEKLKILDKKYEHFIYPHSYEKIDSYFYNIIMKKGYDFILNTKQLNFRQLLISLYNLVDSIEILSDNNILLLDIKPDNFLFSEIEEHLYKSVIIDFSGELLIENLQDFSDYLDNFEFFCHDFWPMEINILLHRMGLKKHYKNIKKEIVSYEDFLQKKLGTDKCKNTNYELKIYKHVIEQLDNIKHNKSSYLYQKIMIYQIGRSFEYILHTCKKSLKITDTEFNTFRYIIKKITRENYFIRYNIKKFKTLLTRHIPELNNSLIKIDKIL